MPVFIKYLIKPTYRSGAILYYMHPILGILFYSPAITMKIVPIILIIYFKNKIYPHNSVINNTLFYFILSTATVSMAIINPMYFFSSSIIFAIILYWIIHQIYNWEYRYKMPLLFFSLAIIMFLTSGFFVNYITSYIIENKNFSKVSSVNSEYITNSGTKSFFSRPKPLQVSSIGNVFSTRDISNYYAHSILESKVEGRSSTIRSSEATTRSCERISITTATDSRNSQSISSEESKNPALTNWSPDHMEKVREYVDDVKESHPGIIKGLELAKEVINIVT